MKISSVMEQRHTVEKKRLRAMYEEAYRLVANIPVPRATVAHMQWGSYEEETLEESHALYVCSAASGFRNTPGVPIMGKRLSCPATP